MKIVVNGEAVDSDADTVSALILGMGAHPEGVAVALNGEVVPKGERAERRLQEGDRVEVIRAVGGG